MLAVPDPAAEARAEAEPDPELDVDAAGIEVAQKLVAQTDGQGGDPVHGSSWSAGSKPATAMICCPTSFT